MHNRSRRWPVATSFALTSLVLFGCSGATERRPNQDSAEAVTIETNEDSDAVLQGLTECDSLRGPGGPVLTPSPFSQFTQINSEIRSLVASPEGSSIVAYDGGQNVYGRLTVTLSTRDSDTLRRIKQLDDQYGRQDDICVQVPPVGYYDQRFKATPWRVAEFSEPVAQHWQALNVRVGFDCGGSIRRFIRAPDVVYTATEVQVTFTLDHRPWGADEDLVCIAPPIVVLQLPEDPAGRPLVDGCPEQDCPTFAQQQPASTPPPPTPPPPLPAGAVVTGPDTALQLQQILIESGFDHIVGDAPGGPSWSATATWDDQRYDVALYQGQPPTADDDTEQLVCRVGTLVFEPNLPDDARSALKRCV